MTDETEVERLLKVQLYILIYLLKRYFQHNLGRAVNEETALTPR